MIELKQRSPLKKFVLSGHILIKIMITSVVEMLKLPNFCDMAISTKQFESRDKILLVTQCTKIMTS